MGTSTYFDLHRELTTNTKFINRISRLMAAVTKAEAAGETEDMREYMKEMLASCEYNPSLLAPYFFPQYPEDEPMTFWSRPHAFAMMSFVGAGSLSVCSSRQIGKCITCNSLVTTEDPEGNRKEQTMGDFFEEMKAAHLARSEAASTE